MNVVRSRITDGSDFDLKLQIEFSLVNLLLLNHFGELDATQRQFLKRHVAKPEFSGALIRSFTSSSSRASLKKIVEQVTYGHS